MDPDDFLKFAMAIENAAPQFLINEETACRTGIGRAQYSVFLEYRDEIGALLKIIDKTLANTYQDIISGKNRKKRKGSMHGIVPKIIGEINPFIYDQYVTLRTHRNTADYEMGPKISIKELNEANQLADNIKSRIGYNKHIQQLEDLR